MRATFFVFFVGLALLASCRRAPSRVSGPALPQDVYVWQRAHSPAVAGAVRAHARDFSTTVVLVAEVAWRRPGDTVHPHVTRVFPDWSALTTAPRLGLALRINAHPGPFARDDSNARTLATLARELLADATAHGANVTEFQIDFDAATAKLAGYREWLIALRDAVAPVPLVFTALPAWLRSSDFPALARTTGRYVLQVHSLARPARVDSAVSLCDPAEARAAIERAAQVGVPFRVALPTYGYALAFDRTGRFTGLSAEGPNPVWLDQPGITVRQLSADPAALAALIGTLNADRPSALTGVIWYRLPVAGDRLNWSWPALAAVMAGRIPAPQLAAEPHTDPSGLVELTLVNRGDGDFAGPVALGARWAGARRLGADALGEFAITGEDPASLHLAAPALRLAAGERRIVGWLRLSPSTALPAVSLEN